MKLFLSLMLMILSMKTFASTEPLHELTTIVDDFLSHRTTEETFLSRLEMFAALEEVPAVSVEKLLTQKIRQKKVIQSTREKLRHNAVGVDMSVREFLLADASADRVVAGIVGLVLTTRAIDCTAGINKLIDDECTLAE